MSELISEWIVKTMTSMGYWGIGLLMFLENLFPPIPSELIMPLAGFTVAKGEMEFVPAVLAGVVGTVLGALPWYYGGKWISEARLRHLADRHGKWLSLSGEDIDKANAWFTRYGIRAVFFCRLVPGVRTLISLPAGVNQMPMLPFLIFSTLGTFIWVSFLTFLGLKLGENYSRVDQWLDPVSKLVLLLLVAGLAYWIWKKHQAAKHKRKDL